MESNNLVWWIMKEKHSIFKLFIMHFDIKCHLQIWNRNLPLIFKKTSCFLQFNGNFLLVQLITEIYKFWFIIAVKSWIVINCLSKWSLTLTFRLRILITGRKDKSATVLLVSVKCRDTALDKSLFSISLTCWENRSTGLWPLWPQYCWFVFVLVKI